MKNMIIPWQHEQLGQLPYALPETHRVAISFLALLPGEC